MVDCGATRRQQLSGAESDKRDGQILSRAIPEEEITKDDVIGSLSTLNRYGLHLMFGLIEKEHGREEAERLAHRAGLLLARSSWRATQNRLGVTHMTFEQIADYENISHKLLGPDMEEAVAMPSDSACIVRRTGCLFRSPTPNTAHLGIAFEQGQLDAFMEIDPSLQVECTHCLHFGDDYCEHVFTRP
jgi:hypothetical protein